jgi:hypothetical protein
MKRFVWLVWLLPVMLAAGERYARWDWLEPAAVPYLRQAGITQVLVDAAAPAEFRAACQKAGIRTVAEAPPGVQFIQEGSWPRLNPMVQMGRGGDKVTAGASGEPWIEANGWLILYYRARAAQPVLLAYDPPKEGRLRPGSLELAAAEAASFGGQFALKLDERLRRGLVEAQPRVVAEWKRVAEQLKFAEGAVFRGVPAANIAVVADALEPVAEVLNLLARRNHPFLVLPRGGDLQAAMAKKYALVIAIAQPPLPPAQPAAPAKPPSAARAPLVVQRKEVLDPEAFVAEMRKRMTGRRLYALSNAETIISYPWRLGDGRLAVHLVNYAIDPLLDVHLRPAAKFSRALLFTPEDAAPRQLAVQAGEVVVPEMNVSAVVVFEN